MPQPTRFGAVGAPQAASAGSACAHENLKMALEELLGI